MEKKKASIVIRTYNEGQHIAKLLQGLSHQDYPNFEVILVDSGSTDGTVEIAQSQGIPVKHVPISKAEFSFGRSLNIGCRAAEGEYLVFVSGHVYPFSTDWLSRLLAPFDNEKVVLSYGCQRGNEITKYSEHRIFLKWFPGKSANPQANYFCNNANCAVRRSEWLNLPYDEELTGLEDLDWAKKAQKNGGQIAYVADSIIIHVHDETWAGVRNRYRREAIAMSKIEDSYHVHFLDFLKLLTLSVYTDVRSLSKEQLTFNKIKEIFQFRFNQNYGSYLGYKERKNVRDDLKERLYYPASSKELEHFRHYGNSEKIINYKP
ncbi:glycosyltransferase [Roseibium suaedae]|uniref:Glycosyl transferase family 2 n=1 Tax=Roseibium suaedae TaxID=735517 RepID=A0A1M7P777_9HYPH|nr:glycosyltransferase family 2 protein [Roseibium suaedae]SHN12470.1 Glycosyl transferase family 2 [Roseibium suaedae]